MSARDGQRGKSARNNAFPAKDFGEWVSETAVVVAAHCAARRAWRGLVASEHSPYRVSFNASNIGLVGYRASCPRQRMRLPRVRLGGLSRG